MEKLEEELNKSKRDREMQEKKNFARLCEDEEADEKRRRKEQKEKTWIAETRKNG